MSNSPEQKIPTVFVSYSHDSREHKAWVATLAQRLIDKGVDVLFDQWDLGPGDDVPKFMEQAVAKADRVLMICSEAYVRKADDGKGGVGYEAMVVTGELVRDLGTNKFIPIVRQMNEPKILPRCVSTRFYVELSDGSDTGENFEILLREIHNQPKLPKPAVGKNPLIAGAFEGTGKKVAKEERRLEFSESLSNPEAAYQRALEIIHADDRVAWRKLLLAATEKGIEALKQWRKQNPEIPTLDNNNTDFTARYAHARSGVESFASLIACLLAASETGKDGYADQLGWIESILEPTGYEFGGTVYHAAFPQLIFFVTQALVGGMLMLSGAGEAAYRLASTKVTDKFNSQDARPLFAMTRCNGWPDTLEHHCTIAWAFLNTVITSWTWLKTVFGNERECRAGISGYYQMMSFLNFIKLTKDNQIDVEQVWGGPFLITAPLCFCVGPREVVEKGYELLLKQNRILKRALEANGLNDSAFEAAWPKWIPKVGAWLGDVYRGRWPEMHTPQAKLPEHLKSDSFVLR
jgi:hypothetical protein